MSSLFGLCHLLAMPSFITIDRFRGEVPCYVLSLAAVLRADERAVTFLCLGAFKKKKKKSSRMEELTRSANYKAQSV